MTQFKIYYILLQRLLKHEVMPVAACTDPMLPQIHSRNSPHGTELTAVSNKKKTTKKFLSHPLPPGCCRLLE